MKLAMLNWNFHGEWGAPRTIDKPFTILTKIEHFAGQKAARPFQSKQNLAKSLGVSQRRGSPFPKLIPKVLCNLRSKCLH